MNKPAGGCVSRDSPEKQSQWDREREATGDLLQEMAYLVMKATKYHHVPPASQRTKKAGSVIQQSLKA